MMFMLRRKFRDGGIRKVNLVNIVKCMWFAALGGGNGTNLNTRTCCHVDNQGTYNTMQKGEVQVHGVGKAKK